MFTPYVDPIYKLSPSCKTPVNITGWLSLISPAHWHCHLHVYNVDFCCIKSLTISIPSSYKKTSIISAFNVFPGRTLSVRLVSFPLVVKLMVLCKLADNNITL